MDKENRTKQKRKLENGRKNKKNKEERQNKEIEERRKKRARDEDITRKWQKEEYYLHKKIFLPENYHQIWERAAPKQI